MRVWERPSVSDETDKFYAKRKRKPIESTETTKVVGRYIEFRGRWGGVFGGEALRSARGGRAGHSGEEIE